MNSVIGQLWLMISIVNFTLGINDTWKSIQ